MRAKAIVLLSGGLDSILAARILREQNLKILGLSFKSPFFSSENAQKAAEELKIDLKILDISRELLKILRKPKYGFGSQMNPCLDCHILMFKKAKKVMEREKYDFVASGEVLNQRPFSQNLKSLSLIEKESNLQGYLLRPLSAKLLKPTIAEKKSLIKREKLFAISGRSRRKQLELAKKFKIKYYPSPAGGCLLTDPEFSKRLKELRENYPKFRLNDIELLKLGRHFWEKKNKIIVGRNHQENLKIKKLAKPDDILLEMENYNGPTTLIRNYAKCKISKDIVKKAKKLTKNYSTKARDKKDIRFSILSFQ